MSKSIQLKNINNEKMYPHPYYPVGSIYLSVVNTNPSTWFGGTWEQIAKGRTLVGVDTNDSDFNTVKKTGGAKSVTLTVNQIPSHSHSFAERLLFWDAGYSSQIKANYTWEKGTIQYNGFNTPNSNNTGGGQSHNNLQPYFTCYIWCRTA